MIIILLKNSWRTCETDDECIDFIERLNKEDKKTAQIYACGAASFITAAKYNIPVNTRVKIHSENIEAIVRERELCESGVKYTLINQKNGKQVQALAEKLEVPIVIVYGKNSSGKKVIDCYMGIDAKEKAEKTCEEWGWKYDDGKVGYSLSYEDSDIVLDTEVA